MANNYFNFKQFTIEQSKTAMKIGTDGILIGAWANCQNVRNILDIGTGTGILAIMMAQKNQFADIQAVEIDEGAFQQACENIANCPWQDRISIYHQSLQEFTANHSHLKFDLIISNPPFFVNSSKTPDNARTIARHNDLLPFDKLIDCVSKLIGNEGRFVVILPVEEAVNFVKLASNIELFLSKKTEVKPVETKPAHRLMMEFSTIKNEIIEETIVIETNRRHYYTDDYKKLTRDFYLHFKDEIPF